MYRNLLKRVIDFCLSFVALIFLSPILVILTVLGFFVMKGNPFFVQERPGRNEKIFKLIKFRSMTEKKDEDGNYLPDEQRLTSYGMFLRKTSLDELPELINILKGDMAIVGPRPLLVSYLDYYTEEEQHRHDVRPGLTGLAQIHGRNFLTWEEVFAYDLKYVSNITFLNDVSIILGTIKEVLNHGDVEDRSKVSEVNGELIYDDGKNQRRVHAPLDVERSKTGNKDE